MSFKSEKPEYDPANNEQTWFYLHCSITVGQEAVRLEFYQDGTNKKLPKASQTPDMTMKVDMVDMPMLPKMPKAGTRINDCVCFVDVKKNKVMSINPWNGRFEALAVELGPKSEDGDFPQFSVEEKEGDYGNYDDKKFWCGYKITADPDNNGLFVGSTPRYHLKYKFKEGADGLVALDGDATNPKATRVRQLQKWAAAHGIDDDMPWPRSGNVLPELQRRLLAIAKPVSIDIEDGFIQKASKLYGSAVSVIEEPEPQPALTDGGDSASWADGSKPGESDPTFGK